MAEFAVTPTVRLVEIYNILAPIRWPARAADVLPGLIGQLGWTMTGDSNSYAHVETDLPVNFRVAMVSTPKGELNDIRFRVTDTIPEGGDTSCVSAAYDALVQGMGAVLGAPSGRKGDKWWDLPTGGRLHLDNMNRYVAIEFLSRGYADVERDEERLGISPDRVLGQDDPADARSLLTVGLSKDGTVLDVMESQSGVSVFHRETRVIGHSPDGTPIAALQGSAIYLGYMLANHPSFKQLFKDHPDIGAGLKDGRIGIRYALILAPGGGAPATRTDMIIDQSRIDWSFLD